MAGPHQPFVLPDSDLPHQKYTYVCMYVCMYVLWWPRTAIRNFLELSRKFNFCNQLILKLLHFFSIKKICKGFQCCSGVCPRVLISSKDLSR